MTWSWRWLVPALGVLVLTTLTAGQTAANNVAVTRAEDVASAITPNALKPDACAAISLTAKLSGSGQINGTAAAELVTGSAVADNMDGEGGNDCIIGGAGVDNMRGSGGTDVCIGGAGTDTFHPSCETAIQ
jgi:Ca2+-binding RTX toxin-like protein